MAVVAWFKCGGSLQEAPFVGLIQDYDLLSQPERRHAEVAVLEMFTESELALLKSYLIREHSWPVLDGSVPLPFYPFREVTSSKRIVTPYSLQPETDNSGFYGLSEEANYDLPFQVWGYYSTPPNVSDR